MADIKESGMNLVTNANRLRCLDAGGNSGVITPTNLLKSLGTNTLINRIQITKRENAKWVKLLEISETTGYCLFSAELMSYANMPIALVIGYVVIFETTTIFSGFKVLLGQLGTTIYYPDLKYKIEGGKCTVWAKSPNWGVDGYVNIHLGKASVIMDEEEPPSDAIRPQ